MLTKLVLMLNKDDAKLVSTHLKPALTHLLRAYRSLH